MYLCPDHVLVNLSIDLWELFWYVIFFLDVSGYEREFTFLVDLDFKLDSYFFKLSIVRDFGVVARGGERTIGGGGSELKILKMGFRWRFKHFFYKIK